MRTGMRDTWHDSLRKRTWKTIRKYGSESELKHYDAFDDNELITVLNEAVFAFEQQAGQPEKADIFVNPRTRKEMLDWIREYIRVNDGFEKDSPSAFSIHASGYECKVFAVPYLQKGELVLANKEIETDPRNRPFVFVTNLPIGVGITVRVNGCDNEIEVQK